MIANAIRVAARRAHRCVHVLDARVINSFDARDMNELCSRAR
jgi:hypothetical protein